MTETIKDRIVSFINYSGLSTRAFQKKIGVSNAYLQNLKSAPSGDILDKIFVAFPDLNPAWLLSGEGDMLKSQYEVDDIEELPQHDQEDLRKMIDRGEISLVPLIHIDSVGGIHSSNDIVTPEYIERLIPITGARPGDLAIYQSGDSMSPAIPSGSLLLIREVEGWREFIGYGDVFVMLLADDRRITKEIRRYTPDPQNYYWCVSYNPDVEDEELPKNYIRRVWKVVKVLIDKGW